MKLDARTASLIAVGASVTANCQPCLEVNAARAAECGAGPVRAYAAKLVGPDDADDVVQEVFLKVSRALGTLADPARFSSWIYAITLNTVRDNARARACRPVPAPEDAEARLALACDPAARTPEEAATRSEMVACYVNYVERLQRD